MSKTKHIIKWNDRKIGERYLDQIIKRSQSIPDSRKYNTLLDWTKLSTEGKFQKQKKETYLDEILK
jgi:hypothetical protein